MRALLRRALRPLKPLLRRHLLGREHEHVIPLDLSPDVRDIIESVWPVYTMTSAERIAALVDGVRYVEAHQVPGAIVECGVWRGGSMMAVAKALLVARGATRDLWMYDTYEGMSAPTAEDTDFLGRNADDLMATAPTDEERGVRCIARLPDVQANLRTTKYPFDRIHFIEGKVEDTIPARAPEQIALLRLDTDWYESTKHELVHLYPRLSPGGLLIIDDYGHWQGARKAVDDYFADASPLLHRIDHTARMMQKPFGVPAPVS